MTRTRRTAPPRSRAAQTAPQRRNMAMSPLMLRRLGVVALWAGTLAAAVYGLSRLEPVALAAYDRTDWRIEWAPEPSTIDDWVLQEVENSRPVRDLGEISLLAPQLPERLAEAVAASPWIANVRRVAKKAGDDKHAGGLVTVEADFRPYVTFILKEDVGYLVDADGVRLPRTERQDLLQAQQHEYHMIYLEGVRGPLPRIGEPWKGDDVRAGLALVKFLHDQPLGGLRNLLRAVDVSNYQNRQDRWAGWLRIRTIRPDTVIHWGRPPGEENRIECSAERKLQLLWAHYREHGQLPARPWIDLRDGAGLDVPAAP